MDWPALIAQAGGPVLAGLLGGVAGALSADRNRAVTVPLVHFAAGAFLGLAAFNLIPEAGETIGWPMAGAAAALGWLLCMLMARWGGSFCPACAAGAVDTPIVLSTPLLVVIAVHSGLDGLPLAGLPARHGSAALIAMAVLVHKVPEGMVVAAVSRSTGRSVLGAIGVTALVEACTFLGVGLGLALDVTGSGLLSFCLAAVGGSFLYLVLFTLRASWAAHRHGLNFCLTAVGAALILLADRAIGG